MDNSSGKYVIDYPSPHEFLNLYLMVEAKVTASLHVVLSVCRRNMTIIFKKWRM